MRQLPDPKPHLQAIGKRLQKEFVVDKQQPLPWWGLLAGLVIFLALGLFRSTPYVQALENEGIDRIMQWSKPYGIEKQNPVALVEINQETYARWGEPTRLPHDRLAAVLEGVAKYKPSLIVFDFDLAIAMQNTPRAKELYAYLGTERLQQTLRRYGQGQGETPKLILMRTFRRDSNTCLRYSRLLDDPQVLSNPSIAFASPTFLNEGVVRFWQFSTRRSELDGCGEVSKGVLPGVQRVFPSVQLLALSWTQGIVSQDLEQKLINCPKSDDCSLSLAGHSINLDSQQQGEQRVIYSLPWGSGGAAIYPASALENPSSYSAWPPLEALQNRVVFIGSTFPASDDWHRTAVGMMPGVWVLINAYYSLRDSGQLRPLGWGWRLLLGIFLLGIYALMRRWLRSGWMKRLMGYVFLVVAVYVGTLFSQQGLWLEVVLMIFALQLMERLVAWVEDFKKKQTKRREVAA